jgi:MFS family permease
MPTSATPGLSRAFLALFLLSTGLTTLAVAGTTPILTLLQAHFAANSAAAMLSRATVTIGQIGVVVGAPLTLLVASRFGRKPVLVGSTLVFALAGCFGYFVDNLLVIVASRFFVGVSSALATTLTAAIVAESYDDDGRNRWMGIMVSVGTFLAMILLPLAGVLGDIGWRQCFLLHLVGIPLALLALMGYRGSGAPAMPGASTERERMPISPGLIALGICAGIAVNAQSMYVPFKLDMIGVRSAAQIGVTLMTVTCLAAVASPFYGKLRSHVSATVVFGIGFGALAGGLAIFAQASSWVVALSGYALFGIAMGITLPNLYAVGSQASNPLHRGALLGQTLAGYYVASLLTQLVLEPLIGGRPDRALMWLTGFSAVACFLSFAAVLRTGSRPATGTV